MKIVSLETVKTYYYFLFIEKGGVCPPPAGKGYDLAKDVSWEAEVDIPAAQWAGWATMEKDMRDKRKSGSYEVALDKEGITITDEDLARIIHGAAFNGW